MYFESVAELIAMNGHGPYVWGSYLITFAGLIALAVYPRIRKKKFIATQKRILARENVN